MFNRSLAFGKLGESLIASWLRSRGQYVLPAYEIETQEGKGPRLFAPDREYITPDLLVFNNDGVRWIEAKHKSVFTWHRISKKWTTGIDRHHYREYIALAENWPWEIWLLFLHEKEEPDPRDIKYCPGQCPVGLFGNSLLTLKETVNHEHAGWGRHGMVYWAEDKLIKLASIEEIKEAATLYEKEARPS